MGNYKVEAKRLYVYELVIQADSEAEAYAKLDEWTADDFTDYETNAVWDFDVFGTDEPVTKGLENV